MSYTRAQVGDAAIPEAHMPGAAHPVNDRPGADVAPAASLTQPQARRAFRSGAPRVVGAVHDTAPGTAGFDVEGTVEAAHTASAAVELPTVDPASRQVATDPAVVPITGERIRQDRAELVMNRQAPPSQYRAGSTGADPTRPSRMPRWIFTRPFDKAMAEHPAELAKIEQGSPLASRPLRFTAAIPGALPSPGGSGAADGMTPVGQQPNTVRLMPQPWDALAINDGGPAAESVGDPAGYAVAGRGRSFRGR